MIDASFAWVSSSFLDGYQFLTIDLHVSQKRKERKRRWPFAATVTAEMKLSCQENLIYISEGTKETGSIIIMKKKKKKSLVVWRRGMEVSCVETTSSRNVAVTLYNKPMARWLHSNGHFEAKRCWHFLFPFIVWRWCASSVWIVVVYR